MNSDPVDLLVKLIKCKSVTPNDDGALAVIENILKKNNFKSCLLYTSPSPRDAHESRMPSSA